MTALLGHWLRIALPDPSVARLIGVVGAILVVEPGEILLGGHGDAVAACLRGNRRAPMDWYVDFEPALGSVDWRCELLSLVEPTGRLSGSSGRWRR